MRRFLVIALLLLVLSGCNNKKYFNIEAVEVTNIEGDEYPSKAELDLTINSSLGAFTLKQSQIRFGVEGRRQVVVTLCDKVKFKRGWQVVTMPVKISVVHNSLTMKLQEALERHDARAIEVDGEIKLRRGLFTRKVALPATTLEELLTEEQLEYIWSVMDENR